MKHCKTVGARVMLEWPRSCSYWRAPRVANFLGQMRFKFTDFDGCMYGLVTKFREKAMPIRKPWRIACMNTSLPQFLNKTCDHKHEHAPCAGRETLYTQGYTPDICKAIHEAIRHDLKTLSKGAFASAPAHLESPKGQESPAGLTFISVTHDINCGHLGSNTDSVPGAPAPVSLVIQSFEGTATAVPLDSFLGMSSSSSSPQQAENREATKNVSKWPHWKQGKLPGAAWGDVPHTIFNPRLRRHLRGWGQWRSRGADLLIVLILVGLREQGVVVTL